MPRRADGSIPTVALVGKGITFDSGGLSLKTADGMMTMKTDMSGAAVVIATLGACRALGIGVRVSVSPPTTENMPGGRAIKPGDVLEIRNGKTIEVLNTDAEGRLVLADGLSLAVEEEPDAIVDLRDAHRRLRGRARPQIAGLMGNDDRLLSAVHSASERAGEATWVLPLPDAYRVDIDSEIADMKNTSKPGGGGALTAGLLLQEFVSDRPWVHLTSPPSRSEEDSGDSRKGSTGFGVRTMIEFLSSYDPLATRRRQVLPDGMDSMSDYEDPTEVPDAGPGGETEGAGSGGEAEDRGAEGGGAEAAGSSGRAEAAARAAGLCIRHGRRVRPVRFSRPFQGSLVPVGTTRRRPRRRRRSPRQRRRRKPRPRRRGRGPPRPRPARRRPQRPWRPHPPGGSAGAHGARGAPVGHGKSAGPARPRGRNPSGVHRPRNGLPPLHLPQDPTASGRKSHREATQVEAGPGPVRPSTLSIDVGGTGLKASVLDANGKLLADRVRVPTTYPCHDLLVDTLRVARRAAAGVPTASRSVFRAWFATASCSRRPIS